MGWPALQELAHWAGALPLVACAILALRRRLPSPDARLLALAFFTSFLTDAIAARLGAPNLWLTYINAPLQFGLFLTVIAPVEHRRLVWAGFGLVVAVSLLRNTWGAQETVIEALAGAWVCLVAYRHRTVYRLPVLLYCGLAIPFLLVMGFAAPSITGPWIIAWVGYQAVRITALGWMTVLLLWPPYSPEVARDLAIVATARTGQPGLERAGRAVPGTRDLDLVRAAPRRAG